MTVPGREEDFPEAAVTVFPQTPLDEMAGTDTGRAVDAAGIALRPTAPQAALLAMCQRVAASAENWGDCSDMRETVAIFKDLGHACRELLENIGRSCDCEEPGGHFYSGIPGILAHLVGGRPAPGGPVERCDQCERYPSDGAARAKLVELGLAPKSYALELDGPLFRSQRELLLRLHHAAGQGEAVTRGPKEHELLEGLLGLTDAIADQAADRDGIDCLIPIQR